MCASFLPRTPAPLSAAWNPHTGTHTNSHHMARITQQLLAANTLALLALALLASAPAAATADPVTGD